MIRPFVAAPTIHAVGLIVIPSAEVVMLVIRRDMSMVIGNALDWCGSVSDA